MNASSLLKTKNVPVSKRLPQKRNHRVTFLEFNKFCFSGMKDKDFLKYLIELEILDQSGLATSSLIEDEVIYYEASISPFEHEIYAPKGHRTIVTDLPELLRIICLKQIEGNETPF